MTEVLGFALYLRILYLRILYFLYYIGVQQCVIKRFLIRFSVYSYTGQTISSFIKMSGARVWFIVYTTHQLVVAPSTYILCFRSLAQDCPFWISPEFTRYGPLCQRSICIYYGISSAVT